MMTEVNKVKIAARLVGAASEPYVIAEAGVNHDGEVDKAHRLIAAAAHAGADAVKFQLFSAESLVAASAPVCDYQAEHVGPVTGQRELLRRLEMPRSAFVELKTHAEDAGLHFLATPFGLPELEFLLETLAVPAVKIASPDLVNLPLLSAAASSGVPMVVSTGAADMEEVDRAVAAIEQSGGKSRLVLLHCVSAYPTRLEDLRLRRMQSLRARYRVPVGLSDHSMETKSGACAVLAGAVVLEKHLTLGRGGSGPDHFFSLEPDQFRSFMQQVRRADRILGAPEIRHTDNEREVRLLARARLVASRAIRAGERVTAEAVAVQRPGDGIGPDRWDDVIGRVAVVDIPQDIPLAWSMLR